MLLVSCWKNNKILQKLKSKQTRTWYIYSSWNVKGVSIVFVTEKWYVDDFDLKISKTKSQMPRLGAVHKGRPPCGGRGGLQKEDMRWRKGGGGHEKGMSPLYVEKYMIFSVKKET